MKKMVKLFSLALAVVCLVSALMAPAASAAPYRRSGGIVTFGHYEQDNIRSNGKEPIEWIILYEDSTYMLLLSRYALASERYNYKKASVSWDTCSVRDWMNNTFYYDAFNGSERSCIVPTSRPDSYSSDNVFALSVGEAEYYFSGNRSRICYPTTYCAGQNLYVNPSTQGCWWLLSTTGEKGRQYAMSVNSDGKIDYEGGRVESDRGAVRPAIWVLK